MGPRTRVLAALVVAAAASPAVAAEGPGLTISSDVVVWPRWQGRVALQNAPAWGSAVVGSRGAATLGSLSAMSDYYVTPSFLGPRRSGGFRATSGLLIGPRPQSWTVPSPSLGGTTAIGDRRLLGGAPTTTQVPGDTTGDAPTVPYVGVGYTGLSARGGWSFSADLGIASHNAGGAVKLGRVFSGSQSLDDAVRDMRWSPLVQLGVSYSF